MLGIYGGTFDPVHFGHLRTALDIYEALDLTEIRLIPCFIPPHRNKPSATSENRVAMLRLAINGIEGLTVDTREIDRGGPSYMVDTLKSIRAEISNRPMCLIVGEDAFANLNYWHHWQHLFDYAHIVVMTRPGYKRMDLIQFFQDRLVDSWQTLRIESAGGLFFQQVTALDISATQIRQIFANSKNPGFLLPDTVIKYITDHKLYQRTCSD